MKPKFYLFLLSFLFIGSIIILAQPLPPNNLTAVQASGMHGQVYVKLNWASPSTMLHFNVYRKNGALSDTGSFVRRYTGLSYPKFDDKNVMQGHTYSYYVTAYNPQGESEPSNKVEITLNNTLVSGNVSGVVTNDVTNLLIKNATAMFIRISGWGMGLTAKTDSNGVFNINLPAGTYYLKTLAYGYFYEFFDNVPTIQNATPVVVTDSVAVNLNIGLAPFVPPVIYTVSGSVKDSLGNPLMANVKAFNVRLNSHFMCTMSVRTDSLGNYSVPVKGGDTVVVYAMPLNRDYFPEFWDNKMTFAEADRIPISGNVTDINFVLQHKPVFENGIAGVVEDTLGVGVESFVSAIRKDMGFFRRYVVSTDSLGVYSFTNLIPGKYILLASPKDGYKPTFFRYDGTPTLNWRDADSVMVTETSLITGIDFTVHACPLPGEGLVAGTVANQTGQPVDAAFAYALDVNNDIAGFAISDANGNYTIAGLNPGDYKVVSDKIEFAPGTPVNVSIDYISNFTQTANLLLTPESITGVQNTPEVISSYQLYQNYPNPFNPVTNIKFSLPEKSNVKITIYNLLGVQVARVADGVKDAGTHVISFDASTLASGVYFYRIEAGKYTSTRKLTLLK